MMKLQINRRNILPAPKVAEIIKRYLPYDQLINLLAFPDNKKQLVALVMFEGIWSEQEAIEYVEELLMELNIESITQETKLDLSGKGPLQFLENMLKTYEGSNLGNDGSLLSEGISGGELPNQYGTIVTYSLHQALSLILEDFSGRIGAIVAEYKKNNPSVLIDYVSYDADNLHVSIAQSGFVNSLEELSLGSDLYPQVKFNDLPVNLKGVVATKDSIVLKMKPFPFPHIINQLIAKNKFNEFELDKLGRGTQITLGRFVGVCDDKKLITDLVAETHRLNEKLEQQFSGLITLLGSEIKPHILNHYFSSKGGSKFYLSNIQQLGE